MESRFLLDIVVGKSTTILKLLSSKDQTLLVGGNTFLVLDLGLDVIDGVGRLNFEGDRLSCQSLDKDLHASTETEDKVKGRFLLNVVIGQGTAIFELFASEDQALLVGGNTTRGFVSAPLQESRQSVKLTPPCLES